MLDDEFFICATVKEATDTKMIVTLCIIVKITSKYNNIKQQNVIFSFEL